MCRRLSSVPLAMCRPATGSRGLVRRPRRASTRRAPPTPLSSFVGREGEIRAIVAQLESSRLVTLTGAGGCGKTRLALATAFAVDREAVWLDLHVVHEGAGVGPALAEAFGVERASAAQLCGAVAASIAEDDMLLLADNAEHVVAELAAVVGELLPQCPRLVVLVTSRERLGVSGEIVRVVPPLALPPPDADPAALRQFSAAQCFLERADAAAGSSRAEGYRLLDAADAATVARLCRRLDGMPLALELAAARTTTLSLQQIDERLGDTMRLLTLGPRDAPERHRTLRATLDWSNALLPTSQRLLLRRLAVFAGSFTLDAAEGVCADDALQSGDVLDLLSGLLARSMVSVPEDGASGRRFRLLETVRQYAQEKLSQAGEADRVARRHAEHYLGLMRAGNARLLTPTGDPNEQQALLAALEADHTNVRAALTWAWSAGDRQRYVVDIAAASWWFWWTHGDHMEGMTWLRRALALLDTVNPRPDLETQAEVWHGLGWLARHQGEPDEAHRWLEAARAAYVELGDLVGESISLHRLAALAIDRGDHEDAVRLLADSLDRARSCGVQWVLGVALYWEGVRRGAVVGPITQNPPDTVALADAARLLRSAAGLFERCGDRWAVGRARGMLAGTLARAGDLIEAESALLEARTCGGAADDRWGLALWSLREAEIHLARGNLTPAAGAVAAGLRAFTALGDQQRISEALLLGARVAAAAGETEAAQRLRENSDSPGGAVVSGLGALLDGLSRGAGPRRSRPAGLTNREVEVLGLAAEGLSDEEIGTRLFLSSRTVGGHLGSAYRKLGVRSRTAALHQASQLGLLTVSGSAGNGATARRRAGPRWPGPTPAGAG